jgi:hypothetical protein
LRSIEHFIKTNFAAVFGKGDESYAANRRGEGACLAPSILSDIFFEGSISAATSGPFDELEAPNYQLAIIVPSRIRSS